MAAKAARQVQQAYAPPGATQRFIRYAVVVLYVGEKMGQLHCAVVAGVGTAQKFVAIVE